LKAGIEASVLVVTPEESPLAVFGRGAAERVSELLEGRGIEVITGATPVRFSDRVLTVSHSAPLAVDAVVTMPKMEGRTIAGVPHDLDGFIGVDAHCRIRGMRDAFAAGDVTQFPVKQGGIASQQADVAAEAIAADLGCKVPSKDFDPVLRGVLWTGAEPLYLSGHLAGGHGETSIAADEPPWDGDEEGKLVGRYLTPFFAGLRAGAGAG
jgi:sulfide:quinone oxidoreductase